MYVFRAANAVTGTGAQTADNIAARSRIYGGVINLLISISGGTSRTVQFEGSPDGTNWFPIGTSRTTAASFLESVPALPYVRLNVSANVGSTINAWVAVPGELE